MLIAAPFVAAQTTVEQFKALAWDKTHAGTPLDLSKYKQTFVDNFDKMDVTADGGAGPWFAPIHSTFGAGKFIPPGPDGPFKVVDGKMTITSQKSTRADGKEKWTSGNMQTVDSKGQGFAQKYGYFECTYQAPAGPGSWLGFWLLSQNGFLDPTQPRCEIDAVEWYGGDPNGVHVTPHIWPAAKPGPGAISKHVGRSTYFNIKSMLTNGQLEGFHQYGVEVTPDFVIGYFDRKEIARFKCLPEFQTPLYMLVTNAVFPKQAAVATSPLVMTVQQVAAYAPIAGQ
jgi:beta-glucanase (GH16 family)